MSILKVLGTTKSASGRRVMPPHPKDSKELQRPLLRLSGPDNLVQKGFKLQIEHLPTGHSVEFAAFLDNISDAYNSEWSSEQVYGRMDPIATFQTTHRSLSVSWMIPAESELQAVTNLDSVNTLLSFLYPLYEGGAGTNINMGPLMRVKFGNLIQDAATGGGLMGYLNGFTMDPETDAGYVTYEDGFDGRSGPELYPKAIRLNFEMKVLHEHPLGWVKQGDDYVFRGVKKGFPYGTPFSRGNDAVTTSTIPKATPPLTKKADGSTSAAPARRVEPNSAAAAKRAAPAVLQSQTGQSNLEKELRAGPDGLGDKEMARLRQIVPASVFD